MNEASVGTASNKMAGFPPLSRTPRAVPKLLPHPVELISMRGELRQSAAAPSCPFHDEDLGPMRSAA